MIRVDLVQPPPAACSNIQKVVWTALSAPGVFVFVVPGDIESRLSSKIRLMFSVLKLKKS